MLWGAGYALFSIPNGSSHRADLTLLSCRVFVGDVRRAAAGKGSVVPNFRSIALDALPSVCVEIRVETVTSTSRLGGIESESRRAALALFSVVVPVGIIRAALTFLGSLIPVFRLWAADASLKFGEDRLVLGARAKPGVSIDFEASRASQASFSVRIPFSRGRAVHTVASGINVREVRRTLALFGGGIFNLVKGAFALLRGTIVNHRSTAFASA